MRSITIKEIQLYPIALPFVRPFRTSFGEQTQKFAIIIEVVTEEGVIGWGESSVEKYPGYGSETVVTGLHILKEFLLPGLIGRTIEAPHEVPRLVSVVRGHHHTKAGLEAAIWDALAKAREIRLVDLLAEYMPEGHRSSGVAHVGVSIGIQNSIEETIEVIRASLDAGYGRIKLKIKPGWDLGLVSAVRERFPDILLMLDANSAYTLEDAEHLAQFDEFNLLMIEQPLAHYDIYEHGLLQSQIKTPICLDESVKSVNDFQVALQVGACRILNLKPARVGGFVESLKIYRLAAERNIPIWIGGMLETGIGRAANVTLASFPAINLPCDISATNRYFRQDIAEPPFILNDDSTLSVPDGIGIGVEAQRDRLREAMENLLQSSEIRGLYYV